MKVALLVLALGGLTVVAVAGAQDSRQRGSTRPDTPPAGASGAGCPVTDLMPSFWTYWQIAKNRGAVDQDRLFTEMLRRRHPDVYDAILRGLPLSQAALIERSMRLMQPVEATVRSLSAQLSEALPRELRAFQRSFPEFRCTVPVYFVFAAGAFDGATRQVGGRTALLFGLDVVAQVHGDQLAPLVMHELFHVHHDTVVRNAPGRLYWAVWKEGLATYVSRRLNPDVEETRVCCLPDIPAVTAAMPALVTELLARLDSERPEDYARFLLGGARDVPARSGYYFGHRVAAQLGESRSLADLARLSPDAVRPLIETSLKSLGQ